jgi:DNA topoisomerase-1
MSLDPTLSKDLKKAELRYSHDSIAGITRKKNNDSFSYFDTDRTLITSDIVLDRIKKLAIPPAWSDVWICPSLSGYLQATGFDEKNRKQYLYHEEWKKLSQENKFHKMIFFGKALPEIRKHITKDMAIEDLDKDKILATIIWLLEHTLIRVGNTEYAEENNSFGLTTLRSRHVNIRGKQTTFEFRGKSGVEHTISISHPRITKIIKACVELPGYEIFKYVDQDGQRHPIDSSDVNAYLQTITGEDITAKDFRTWGGTTLCAAHLYTIGSYTTSEEAKKNISKAVTKVAQHLGNTVTVSRNYYIHPVIIETYQKNLLIPHFEEVYKHYSREKEALPREEFATLTLLRKYM